MNRRGFFSLLAGVAATAVLDPEKLLWVAGKKLISIPKFFSSLEMEEFEDRYIQPALENIAKQMESDLLSFYDVISGNAMYRFRMYDGKGHLQSIWRPSPVVPFQRSSFPWAPNPDQPTAGEAGE